MELASAEMNPSSEERKCVICLDTLSPNFVRFQPCGHKLDFQCAVDLLHSYGRQSKFCPVCRGYIMSVDYDIESEEKFKKFIVPDARTGGEDCDNIFMRVDEILKPEMSSEERDRVLELRRLRSIDEYISPSFRINIKNVWGRSNGQVLHLKRFIKFGIKQLNDPITQSYLRRVLEISVLSEQDQDKFAAITSQQEQDDREIKKGIVEAVKLFDKRKRNHNVLSVGKVCTVLRDKRSLNVSATKSVIGRITNNGADITIIRRTHLEERHMVFPLKDGKEPDIIANLNRRDRERGIQLAREEIQGAWATVLQETGEDHPITKIQLERSGTGLLQDIREFAGCEYCRGGKHRNGDCQLQESEKMSSGMRAMERIGCVQS